MHETLIDRRAWLLALGAAWAARAGAQGPRTGFDARTHALVRDALAQANDHDLMNVGNESQFQEEIARSMKIM